MSTTLNTGIYIRPNTVTHISNRICFAFHLKFPFFCIDEINMLKSNIDDVSPLPTLFADSSTPSSQKTTNSTSTGQ